MHLILTPDPHWFKTTALGPEHPTNDVEIHFGVEDEGGVPRIDLRLFPSILERLNTADNAGERYLVGQLLHAFVALVQKSTTDVHAVADGEIQGWLDRYASLGPEDDPSSPH